MLRTNAGAFGHRLAMDYVVPGGVATDLAAEHAAAMRDECTLLEREIAVLRDIYDEHDGLQDRFRACGIVTPALAAKLGLTGLAGRASGIARDLRCDFPARALRRARRAHRDARATATSPRASPCASTKRGIAASHPRDRRRAARGTGAQRAARNCRRSRSGWATSKAGAARCFVALECGPDGTIRRCHPHDPSWSNWPVLEHAVIGNIVPDFPLINKSFNLSYSGHDL